MQGPKKYGKDQKAGADSVVSLPLSGAQDRLGDGPSYGCLLLDVMLRDRDLNLRVEEIVVPDSFAGKPIRALNLIKHPIFSSLP